MSLPRSHRRLNAICLLLVVAACFAPNAQAFNVSAGTFKDQTALDEVASVSNTMILPESVPVNADAAPLVEEALSGDDAEVFTTTGHRRGQCWKLPARATLAAFDVPDADELFRRPAFFRAGIETINGVPTLRRVRALRPVCLMPLPFTPDRKNDARQMAAATQPTFKAS